MKLVTVYWQASLRKPEFKRKDTGITFYSEFYRLKVGAWTGWPGVGQAAQSLSDWAPRMDGGSSRKWNPAVRHSFSLLNKLAQNRSVPTFWKMDSQGRKVVVCDNGTGVSLLSFSLHFILISAHLNNLNKPQNMKEWTLWQEVSRLVQLAVKAQLTLIAKTGTFPQFLLCAEWYRCTTLVFEMKAL